MKDQFLTSVEDISHFLKSRKVDSLALILIDGMSPFQRTIQFSLFVFTPLFSLIFGTERIEKIESFFQNREAFELLKRSLEKNKI